MNFTEDWFSQNIPVWEQALAHLKGKPILAAEIGTYEGRSAVWLLDNILTHPEAHLDCIDTFEGSKEHKDIDMKAVEERARANLEPYGKKVTIIKNEGWDELMQWRYDPVDLIYIDGSHAAADVLRDAVLADIVLNPGGILIFDDYGWAGLNHAPNVPRGAIDAFMECYAEQYDQVHIGYQVILKKK